MGERAPLATWKVCSEPSVTAASVLSSPGRSMDREYLLTCHAQHMSHRA